MFGKLPNDYTTKADQYAKFDIEGTLLLAYSQFERLFTKYVHEGKRALDFGCGTGRSTRFLKSTGFVTHGVDLHPSMIQRSQQEDNQGIYKLIQSNKIPERDSYYDLAFSAFVMLEMPSLNDMEDAFKEIYRTMRFNGTFIMLTVNEDFYSHQWASIETDYPENKNVKSGDKLRVKIKNKKETIELYDYYWTGTDYRKTANQAGFTIVEEIRPKATQDDTSIEWISEKDHSPYAIFVMQKTEALILAHKKAGELKLDAFGEKGYFKETERSEKNEFSRAMVLMEPNQKRFFHRMQSDETLEYIKGSDLTIHLIHPDGRYEKKFLGKEEDQALTNIIIPKGTWFAEEYTGKSGYSILTVKNTPAFQPNDVEEAERHQLLNLVNNSPEATEVVQRLTEIQIQPRLTKKS